MFAFVGLRHWGFDIWRFGRQPFVLLPETTDDHHQRDGTWLKDKEPIDSMTKTEANEPCHFSSGDLFITFRPYIACRLKRCSLWLWVKQKRVKFYRMGVLWVGRNSKFFRLGRVLGCQEAILIARNKNNSKRKHISMIKRRIWTSSVNCWSPEL